MKLLFRNPAQAANLRIERKKRYLATSGKSETDEKPFRWRHTRRYNSSSKPGKLPLLWQSPSHNIACGSFVAVWQ
jgi:hypothetical protein